MEHVHFEDVSLRVQDGMDDLFDNSKPHFTAWLQTHDMDKGWSHFGQGSRKAIGSPLYYAAFCGFYDLAERLIMEHPEQANLAGGFILAPLPAALSKRHFRVADLLSRHGAVVDVRDREGWTSLHVSARILESVDITRWLLKHGANASAQTHIGRTPLHHATYNVNLEAAQALLEYNPDIGLRDRNGDTPLHDILSRIEPSTEGKVVEIVWRLLEYGADPNIRRDDGSDSTPLHLSSFSGSLEVTRLLLSYGARIDEEDEEWKTPFEVASSHGHDEIMKLLLEP